MKKYLLLTLALVLVLSLAACSSAEKNLIIATGGTGGTYYPLGGGIAQIITDNTDAGATAQSTGASVENMRLLQSKDVDLAFTQTDIADYASKGIQMMEETGKVENLTGVATLYYETVQIILPADSDVNSVDDLKGKRVSVGAAGSGTEANAKQILEVYGITFDDIKAEHIGFSDSSAKIQDGNLDAAFVTAGAPTSAVTELSATRGVKILSIADDKIQELKDNYPYYAKQIIPADTYAGVDEVTTVAVKAMLVARKGLSEDLVYNIVKSIYENTDKLIAINAKAKAITLDTALEGMSLELHPGALKFYKEKGLK